MEVMDLVRAKLHLARRVLQDLINNYEGMEDSERLEKSNTILDEVNSYLRIEENLLLPMMRRSGRHDDLAERARDVHAEIDLLTERMIMKHVDEPDGSYYQNLVLLAGLLDQTDKVDNDIIVPWAHASLTDEDQHYIATHLKNQMTHESLPSSGMTTY